MASRVGSLSKVVVIGLVVALALLSAFWAGQVTLRAPVMPASAPDSSVVVTVTEQSVGKVLTFNVTARQPRRVLAVNALDGVVTQVGKSGRFRVGDVAYRVANVPVRVVEGRTPFYRALQANARGRDVLQLKAALHELGYLRSYNRGNSRFDWATVVAVRAWQKKLGTGPTGTVALGELVAVPSLPAQLIVDPRAAQLGASLGGGEEIIAGTAGDPVFTMELQQEQARLVPMESAVTVRFAKRAWRAVITGSSTDENSQVVLALAAPSGGRVCGGQCDELPAAATSYLLSEVAVVRPRQGPAVPVAAITTEADGRTTVLVVDDLGARTERAVTVNASQDGVALVDGVRVGERVQVLGGEAPTSAPVQPPAPSRSVR